MTGEAWTVIAGKGATFNNINNPVPVVRVGETNSQGLTEISDIVFSTVGPGWSFPFHILPVLFNLCTFSAWRNCCRMERQAARQPTGWCWNVGLAYQVSVDDI